MNQPVAILGRYSTQWREKRHASLDTASFLNNMPLWEDRRNTQKQESRNRINYKRNRWTKSDKLDTVVSLSISPTVNQNIQHKISNKLSSSEPNNHSLYSTQIQKRTTHWCFSLRRQIWTVAERASDFCRLNFSQKLSLLEMLKTTLFLSYFSQIWSFGSPYFDGNSKKLEELWIRVYISVIITNLQRMAVAVHLPPRPSGRHPPRTKSAHWMQRLWTANRLNFWRLCSVISFTFSYLFCDYFISSAGEGSSTDLKRFFKQFSLRALSFQEIAQKANWKNTFSV